MQAAKPLIRSVDIRLMSIVCKVSLSRFIVLYAEITPILGADGLRTKKVNHYRSADIDTDYGFRSQQGSWELSYLRRYWVGGR